MTTKPTLTAERLREVLDYDPATGVFRWRVACGNKMRQPGDIAGSLTKNGYWEIGVDGRRCYAHRLVWLHVYAFWPPDQIDHYDQDRSNNRLSNLRLASDGENKQNRRSARSDSSTGVLGVSPNGRRWSAEIKLGGVRHYLGTYDSPTEAGAAYHDARLRLHPFAPHHEIDT